MTTRQKDSSFRTGPAAAMRMRGRRFRSLASRLVALGLGQLVLLALTAAGIFFAEGPHEPGDPEDKLTSETVGKLERLVDSPSALSDALDELRADRIEVSLYDDARQLIASNVDPPLAIPPRPPHHGRHPPEFGGEPRPDFDRGPPPELRSDLDRGPPPEPRSDLDHGPPPFERRSELGRGPEPRPGFGHGPPEPGPMRGNRRFLAS